MKTRAFRCLSPAADISDRRSGRTVLIWWLCAVVVAGGLLAQVYPRGQTEGGDDPFQPRRERMVEDQVRKRGIDEPMVLMAMEDVPRHLFVPEEERPRAYDDEPVTVAPGQTVSQAYLSARMISLLDLDKRDRVLEIGTGSGYDAALLSRMVAEVFTIEIDQERARTASRTLKSLGYDNVHVKTGDGYRGWPDKAPFDAILFTTAPKRIPEPLFDQLKVGGRMVVAVGDLVQDLQVITKTADGRRIRSISPVVLSPMEGEVTRE